MWTKFLFKCKLTNRRIKFVSIDRHARGEHSGMQGSAHLKGVLNYEYCQTKIEPFASIDYVHVHEKAFTEKGADSVSTKVSSRNTNLLTAEAGANFSRCYVSSTCNLNSYLELSVIQESRFNGKEMTARFLNGCTMKLKGLYPSRTLAGIAAGVNTQIGAKTISLNYEGKYGSGFRDSAFYIQLQRQF